MKVLNLLCAAVFAATAVHAVAIALPAAGPEAHPDPGWRNFCGLPGAYCRNKRAAEAAPDPLANPEPEPTAEPEPWRFRWCYLPGFACRKAKRSTGTLEDVVTDAGEITTKKDAVTNAVDTTTKADANVSDADTEPEFDPEIDLDEEIWRAFCAMEGQACRKAKRAAGELQSAAAGALAGS